MMIVYDWACWPKTQLRHATCGGFNHFITGTVLDFWQSNCLSISNENTNFMFSWRRRWWTRLILMEAAQLSEFLPSICIISRENLLIQQCLCFQEFALRERISSSTVFKFWLFSKFDVHLSLFHAPIHVNIKAESTAGSLEEFTSLMQGQFGSRNMEQEIHDAFSVFQSEKINDKLLKLMVQV